jgi:hypothetical protein
MVSGGVGKRRRRVGRNNCARHRRRGSINERARAGHRWHKQLLLATQWFPCWPLSLSNIFSIFFGRALETVTRFLFLFSHVIGYASNM